MIIFFPALLFIVVRLSIKDPIFFKKDGFDIFLQDQRTERPVPGALAHLTWTKRVGGSFGGPGFAAIKEIWVMSDGNGKIQVSDFKSIHVFSTFESFDIKILQPLYEKKRANMYETNTRSDNSDENRKMLEHDLQKAVFVPLVSLSDKYKDSVCFISVKKSKSECFGRGDELLADIMDARDYFKNVSGYRGVGNQYKVSKEVYREYMGAILSKVYSKSEVKPDWMGQLIK